MAIECGLLQNAPPPFKKCPKCDADFEPFLRGMVQRSPWPWWNILSIGDARPYCALICRACKEIVGYELP
jgi:hypothetical protein